ncbi:MAG: threonine synthase [Bacteroidales bacterium]|jgi:threonine synthase
MQLYSTNNRNNIVSFSDAVVKGIADDGGLFLPVSIPTLPQSFFKDIESLSFQDIAYIISKELLKDEISDNDLKNIISGSLDFPVPLVKLGEGLHILELFHGPTLAFKDFGARFMAAMLSHITRDSTVILVATSGDTGSAVANGFYGIEGIQVVLLYPSGKVSHIQEQQLTTLDKNVTALEINGTFDDCQRLVKQAFADDEIKSALKLSSANSINIARLLPQSFYYHYAYAQLKDKSKPVIFSVPSGNLGNLTGGLLAKEMGLPVHKFIAAVNANDILPQYLSSGKFVSKPSVQTISNAMDVGNPSNFARIVSMYDNSRERIDDVVFSRSYSDSQTEASIKELFAEYNYVADPHGAVGYAALKDFLREFPGNYNSIILETAHPAKFSDTVEKIIGKEVNMPDRLAQCLKKDKRSIKISSYFEDFKSFLATFATDKNIL